MGNCWAVVLTLLSGSEGLVTTSDLWNQWRGPTRDGQSVGEDWPESFDCLQPRWRVPDLGASYAGPIVAEDRIFSVESKGGKELVSAFDIETGDLLWQTVWAGEMQVPFFAAKNGSWVRSTPTFDGTSLYVGGMRDVLCCLDPSTGEIRWRVDFCERFDTELPAFGLVCSPLVHGDNLWIQGGGGVVCLDKETGATRWRALVDGGGMNSAFSSPTLATIRGETQLLIQTRTELCGLQPDTGAVLWRTEVPAFRGMNILTPTVWNDAVFTSAYGGRSFLFDVVADDSETWSVAPRWNVGVQGYMTSPVVFEGHGYLFLRSNRFTCLDLNSGESKWTSPPTGDEYWSLIAKRDRILALSDQGKLRLVAASPEEYRVIDEVQVSEQPTWAHLAVAGDAVVIREQNGLAVFDWVENSRPVRDSAPLD